MRNNIHELCAASYYFCNTSLLNISSIDYGSLVYMAIYVPVNEMQYPKMTILSKTLSKIRKCLNSTSTTRGVVQIYTLFEVMSFYSCLHLVLFVQILYF